jgi:molybdopterin/thiamine biosynthesis adenylyltransferase
LRWELANFADAGLGAQLRRSQTGDPTITTSLRLSNGREIPVAVSFPFEYPANPPSVSVEAGLLGPPHEESGGLCLFDNPGAQWNPSRSAARLIHVTARRLLEDSLIRGVEAVAENEEQIPFVASHRYWTDAAHVVLVPDPFWTEPAPEVLGGIFVIAGKGRRRLVTRIESLGAPDERLRERVLCEDGVEIGKWLKLDVAPAGFRTPQSMFELAREELPTLLEAVRLGDSAYPTSWVALTYPEEGPRRGEWRRAWTFLEINESASGPERMPQAQALTPAERLLRLPELAGIDEAKVVLVGVGSLGSKVAVELAKAGAQLVLIDSDHYDVNNSVRHELPAWQAGVQKAKAVAEACQRLNPFCEVEAVTRRLGDGREAAEVFLRQLDGADLVVETTGSRSLTRVLERYCRAAEIPLLAASLTRGSRGGDMVLLRTEDCFDCFLSAQEAGEIPKPDQAEQELVIPVNCGDPAFSGSGFDASSLASDIARLAIQSTGKSSYPGAAHNWVVRNFVAEPTWSQGLSTRDPACQHR